MKKLICGLLAALTLMGCAACGKSNAAGSRLEKIKKQGYIEMTTEPYFAPFEFIDASKTGDDQYMGVDIEIGKAVAEKLGVELKIVPLEFSAVLAGITSGKYDMAISALAYSPAREENMNMSVGYYFGDESDGYGFLVREADKDKYNTVESLENAVIVTQSGSVQESLVNSSVPKYGQLKLVTSMTNGFLMVAEGKADVCVCDAGNGQLYADANGGLAVTDYRFAVDEAMKGTRVGLPKGEDELTQTVNQVVEELIQQGKIEQWYADYAAYAKTLGLD